MPPTPRSSVAPARPRGLVGGSLATVLALALIVVPGGAANAAEQIGNGDFETGPATPTTVIAGWTAVDGLLDLGAASLAGCTTVDTSDYSRLPLYGYERGVTGFGVTPTADVDGVALHPTTGVPLGVSAAGALVAAADSGATPLYYDTTVSAQGFYYRTAPSTPPVGAFDPDVAPDVFQAFFGLPSDAAVEAADDVLPSITALFQATFPPASDPLQRQDNVPPMSEAGFWRPSPQSFASQVVTSTPSLTFSSRVLAMTSEVKARTNLPGGYTTIGGVDYRAGGYVAHGPAVFSDPFTTTRPMTLNLDWRATAERDYYHVLGYVLDVNTCQQTEVIDSSGGDTGGWQTSSVTIPTPGDYRFVFVSGTYDYTWGTGAGANFFIDNITVVPVDTQLTLTPDFAVGSPAGGASFAASGSGLQSNSPWTATLDTGEVVGSGTADLAGAFATSFFLPSGIAPGRYTVTLSGLAPDGATITRLVFVTVGDDGLVGSISSSGLPGVLPATGADGVRPAVLTSAVLLLVGAGLLVAGTWSTRGRRQRRRPSAR